MKHMSKLMIFAFGLGLFALTVSPAVAEHPGHLWAVNSGALSGAPCVNAPCRVYPVGLV